MMAWDGGYQVDESSRCCLSIVHLNGVPADGRPMSLLKFLVNPIHERAVSNDLYTSHRFNSYQIDELQ